METFADGKRAARVDHGYALAADDEADVGVVAEIGRAALFEAAVVNEIARRDLADGQILRAGARNPQRSQQATETRLHDARDER
jgi:hypothetical protein